MNPDGERVGREREKTEKKDCNGACPDDINPPPFITAENQAHAIMTVPHLTTHDDRLRWNIMDQKPNAMQTLRWCRSSALFQ